MKSGARMAERGGGFLGNGSKPPSPPAKGSGERCKLDQWDPGRSSGKCGFSAFRGLENE